MHAGGVAGARVVGLFGKQRQGMTRFDWLAV